VQIKHHSLETGLLLIFHPHSYDSYAGSQTVIPDVCGQRIVLSYGVGPAGIGIVIAIARLLTWLFFLRLAGFLRQYQFMSKEPQTQALITRGLDSKPGISVILAQSEPPLLQK
jgi:hypothetical protein